MMPKGKSLFCCCTFVHLVLKDVASHFTSSLSTYRWEISDKYVHVKKPNDTISSRTFNVAMNTTVRGRFIADILLNMVCS